MSPDSAGVKFPPPFIFLSSVLIGLGISRLRPMSVLPETLAILWVVLMLIPALFIMRTQVIAREEAYLERAFGGEYVSYKASVRRWI